MPDKKSTASKFLEQDAQENDPQDMRRQLGEPEVNQEYRINEMSDDEIREYLMTRNLEVRKMSNPHGVIAKEGNVRGKIRVGIHLSKHVRLALKSTSVATNRSESVITEEALCKWMESNNLRT
jgi:hypothetical protein